jgi:DNA-3-methyladenine glycosylase
MNLPLKSVKLDSAFYEREDVLVTKFDGLYTTGRIVETEAYKGMVDKASHAYNGRRTTRTDIMYRNGGAAYVYLCYGMHHLFNVVTNKENIPHAVLIRAIEPLEGKEIMLERSGKKKWDNTIGSGPGNMSRAMGIITAYSGISLMDENLFLADDGFLLKKNSIIATPRIGVEYSGEDAELPYRFIIAGHPQVSAKSFTSKFIRH